MTLRTMCALLSYAALGAGGRARAEGPVRLQTVDPLPFSERELEEVVGARVPLSRRTDAPLVLVSPAGEGEVALRMGDATAAVTLGGRTGISAARLVAVAIADLCGANPGPSVAANAAPPTPPRSSPATAALSAPPTSVKPASPTLAAPPPSPPQASAAFEISRGLGSAEPATFGLLADLLLARGRFSFGVGLGLSRTPTQQAGRPAEATLTAGAVRVWGGARQGGLELLAGPFAAPYALEGAVSRTGVLAGGGAMLRYRQRIAGRAQLTAAVRADGFANRFRVSAGDASPSLATPRLALALDVGLGWELGR